MIIDEIISRIHAAGTAAIERSEVLSVSHNRILLHAYYFGKTEPQTIIYDKSLHETFKGLLEKERYECFTYIKRYHHLEFERQFISLTKDNSKVVYYFDMSDSLLDELDGVLHARIFDEHLNFGSTIIQEWGKVLKHYFQHESEYRPLFLLNKLELEFSNRF